MVEDAGEAGHCPASVARESNAPDLGWKPGTLAARPETHEVECEVEKAEREGVEPPRHVCTCSTVFETAALAESACFSVK